MKQFVIREIRLDNALGVDGSGCALYPAATLPHLTALPRNSLEMKTFPDGFLWGAATSAYQIEGSPLADGAGACAAYVRGCRPIPALPPCPLFPASSVWNADVSALPVHPQSTAWVASIGASAPLHPDFGGGLYRGAPIGIPYAVVPAIQPLVPISFLYADESDPGPYPIPPFAPVEGGAKPGVGKGDAHVLLVEAGACRLVEVYAAKRLANGAAWKAGSGAVWDLGSNALRAAGFTSADAAGLPILPGLVRYDEILAGEIKHALRFTASRTQRDYLWPARHQAGASSDPDLPPMGAREAAKRAQEVLRAPALKGVDAQISSLVTEMDSVSRKAQAGVSAMLHQIERRHSTAKQAVQGLAYTKPPIVPIRNKEKARRSGIQIFKAIKQGANAQTLRRLISVDDFDDESAQTLCELVQGPEKRLQELEDRPRRGGIAKAATNAHKKSIAIGRWRAFEKNRKLEGKTKKYTELYEELANDLAVTPKTVERWIREERRANGA